MNHLVIPHHRHRRYESLDASMTLLIVTALFIIATTIAVYVYAAMH